MGTMSYVFFGLVLIPLLGVLWWLIKQDRKKHVLGLIFLIFGVAVAVYTAVKLDKKYSNLEGPNQLAPKPSNFR